MSLALKWQVMLMSLALFSLDILLASSFQETPEPTKAFRQSMEQLIETGQLPPARETLKEEIAAHGENYETFYYEALLLFKERQFQDSLKKLERSFSLEKSDPRVYSLSGLNWVVLERFDLAEPFLKTAVQVSPNDYMAHYHLGRLYYTLQRFQLAEHEFRKVLELNPDFVKGFDNLGLALEAQNKEEDAILAYRKAIELSQQHNLKNEWPSINLAKFLLTKARYEESLKLAQQATQTNPQSSEAFFVMGKVLDKLERYSEAVEALQQSIRNDSNNEEAHYQLGRLYLKLGRKEDAQRETEIFQKLKKAERKKGMTHVSGTSR